MLDSDDEDAPSLQKSSDLTLDMLKRREEKPEEEDMVL